MATDLATYYEEEEEEEENDKKDKTSTKEKINKEEDEEEEEYEEEDEVTTEEDEVTSTNATEISRDLKWEAIYPPTSKYKYLVNKTKCKIPNYGKTIDRVG